MNRRSTSSLLVFAVFLGLLQTLDPAAFALDCTRTQSTSGSTIVQTFTSSDSNGGACDFTWSIPQGVTSINILTVGGGGGGGTGRGGGGGGGGVAFASNFSVTAGAAFGVNVGQGGAAATGGARGTSGGNSSLVRNSDSATVVIGGGGGGGGTPNPSDPATILNNDGGSGNSVSTTVSGGAAVGGNGGGSAFSYEFGGSRYFGRGGNGGTGTTATGKNGGANYFCPVQTGANANTFNFRRTTGGGAGAGRDGYGHGTTSPDVGFDCTNWSDSFKPNGGDGLSNSITGTAVFYGAGGGGSDGHGNGETGNNCATQICSLGRGTGGGAGGSGQSFYEGSASVNLAAGNGTNGRGEGGGGGVTTAARGGSGVVIISYTDPSTNQVIATQPSSQTVAAGTTSFTLSVLATASNGGIISYQWYRRTTLTATAETLSNTSRISGATSATLTIGVTGSTIVASDAGVYYAIATNTYSGTSATVQSANASIIVSILEEDFRSASLASPSDWAITYKNSDYANIGRSVTTGTSTAGTYFQPCLTASSGAATTVTSGATEANTGAGNTKTVSTLGSCDGSAIDTAGNGALRLSSMRLDTTASAVYKNELSVSNGLDITFNYASYYGYRGSGAANNGPADGSSFYLKRGTDTNYDAGGAGGAVGYSTRGAELGVTSGLFAVGFDVYGNIGTTSHVGSNCSDASTTVTDFAGTTYTRVTSQTNSQVANQNKVKILGPTGASRTTGYCLTANPNTTLSSTGLSGVNIASPTVTFSNLGTTSRTAAVSHVIRIILDPSTVSNPKLYVIVDGTIRYELDQVQAYRNSSTFKFGFSSATGGSSTITEFSGLTVNTYNGITPPDAPTSLTISSASANGSRQTFSWTAPTLWGIGELADGATGAQTRSYQVRVIDSNGADTGYTCTTTTTSCAVNGIASGTYTAQVYAINRSGISSIASNGSASFTSSVAVVTTCADLGQLMNGSFEQPTDLLGQTEILFRPDALNASFPDSGRADNAKSYWINTDATSRRVEMAWSYNVGGSGRKSIEGTPTLNGAVGRFAELNADNFGGLYQDIATIPGVSFKWKLWHGARSATNETMKVLIGSTSGTTSYSSSGAATTISLPGTLTQANATRTARAYQIFRKSLSSGVATLTTGYAADNLDAHNLSVNDSVVISGLGSPFDGTVTVTAVTTNTFSYAISGSPANVTTEDISDVTHAFVVSTNSANTVATETTELTDDQNSWGRWEGNYLIPAGQTTTRFLFTSFTPTSGGIGNFLDNIAFTPVAACPDRGLGLPSTTTSYSVLGNDFGSSIGTTRVIAASYLSGSCNASCVSFTGSAVTVRPLSTFNSSSTPIVVRYTMQVGDNVADISSGTLTIWAASGRTHTKYMVDPRRTSVDIKGVRIDTTSGSDSDNIRACVTAATSAGSDDASSTLIIDVSTKGSTETTFASGSPITGDRSNSVTLDGPTSNVSTLINNFRITLSSGNRINRDYYIRIRNVASEDACTNVITANDKLILITPLTLLARRTVGVSVKKGGPG